MNTGNMFGQGFQQGYSMGGNPLDRQREQLEAIEFLKAINQYDFNPLLAGQEIIHTQVEVPDVEFSQPVQQAPQQQGGMGGNLPIGQIMNMFGGEGGGLSSMFGGGAAAASTGSGAVSPVTGAFSSGAPFGGAEAGGGFSGFFGGGSGAAGAAEAAGAGSTTGGSAAGGGFGSTLMSFWPAAAIIAGIMNEKSAREGGYRDESTGGYLKDLFGGKVLEQDVEQRWVPKYFGDDEYGFGGDMRGLANLMTLDFSGAAKGFKEGTLGKLLRGIF